MNSWFFVRRKEQFYLCEFCKILARVIGFFIIYSNLLKYLATFSSMILAIDPCNAVLLKSFNTFKLYQG